MQTVLSFMSSYTDPSGPTCIHNAKLLSVTEIVFLMIVKNKLANLKWRAIHTGI
jgi:hypothetical protein